MPRARRTSRESRRDTDFLECLSSLFSLNLSRPPFLPRFTTSRTRSPIAQRYPGPADCSVAARNLYPSDRPAISSAGQAGSGSDLGFAALFAPGRGSAIRTGRCLPGRNRVQAAPRGVLEWQVRAVSIHHDGSGLDRKVEVEAARGSMSVAQRDNRPQLFLAGSIIQSCEAMTSVCARRHGATLFLKMGSFERVSFLLP